MSVCHLSRDNPGRVASLHLDDREIRLIPINVKGATVNTTNAEAFIASLTRGSAIARSFSPAFDRHGRAYKLHWAQSHT